MSWWYLIGATFEAAILALMRERSREGLLDKILHVQTTWSKAALLDPSQFSFQIFCGLIILFN